MKFYYYMLYRFLTYNDYGDGKLNWSEALIFTLTWVSLHIMSILFCVSTFIDFDIINSMRTGNAFLDRFIIIPVTLIPFVLVLLLIFQKRKHKIIRLVSEFEKESKKKRMRRGWLIVFYFIFSFFIMVLSIIFPTILDKFWGIKLTITP